MEPSRRPNPSSNQAAFLHPLPEARYVIDRWFGRKPALAAVAATCVLALADLVLTTHVAGTTGLLEANPLVHALAGLGVGGIAAFKLFTLALGLGILVLASHRRAARLAALAMLLANVWVMLQWAGYFDEMGTLTSHGLTLADAGSDLLLRL
ncbi:MAG: hypothetical protein KDA05_04575 [Phycisphaerales bacterium]|nr:hypothetical protein [Phycisphaerales bacterium]